MKFRCPCCGYYSYVHKPNGSHDICPICYWEDDPIQLENSDYEGGANGVSLNKARENYLKYGACTEATSSFTRPPKEDEIL